MIFKRKKKSYADVFLKRHPKALRNNSGIPTCIWCNIYNSGKCIYEKGYRDCKKCWQSEYRLRGELIEDSNIPRKF